MHILNSEQVREWDAFTIANEPILAIDLMERAAQQLFLWISGRYTSDDRFVIFAGSGNNGGDALALARLFHNAGYLNLRVVLLHTGKMSTECYTNYTRLIKLNKICINNCEQGDHVPTISPGEIVIDGIFGSGLSRPVSVYWAEVFEHINTQATEVIAIDIPSGMFGDNNLNNPGVIIKAKITLTFQFPKLAFLFAENQSFCGQWYIMDIGLHPGFLSEINARLFVTDGREIKRFLKTRNTFDHKGIFGHAFLVAGSYQKTGAAVLAARACLRSGVGLITVHVPESGRQIMQTAVPEAMICIDETELKYCEARTLDNYNALGIGPGIGVKDSMQNALYHLLENATKPMVLDADALNILAANREWLQLLPKDTILTPHPGEFDRLSQKHSSGYERHLTQIDLSIKYGLIIVLKGAYTSISDSQGRVFFNSNGNPGMATAGSGDVLTGIILSLLAQGYSPIESARMGVFIHGLAGDLAAQKLGYEALIASDIINHLGDSFKELYTI